MGSFVCIVVVMMLMCLFILLCLMICMFRMWLDVGLVSSFIDSVLDLG